MLACHFAWDPATLLGGLRILPRLPRKRRLPVPIVHADPDAKNARTYTLYDWDGVRIGTIGEAPAPPRLGRNEPTILLHRRAGEV